MIVLGGCIWYLSDRGIKNSITVTDMIVCGTVMILCAAVIMHYVYKQRKKID